MTATAEGKTRVAVFGGTFDPPHWGHVRLAEAVLAANLADQVLFVPAALPPHKTDRPISAFEHRLAMLKLAIAGRPRFSVSDMERDRLPEPSYTIVTLRELETKQPEWTLILLIGGDSLRHLRSWRDAETLVRRYPIVTCPRPGEKPDLETLRREWPPDLAEKLHRSALTLSAVSTASSTRAREAAKTGDKETLSALSPEAVWRYIEKTGLYAENTTGAENG